jgi:hypothetical protein
MLIMGKKNVSVSLGFLKRLISEALQAEKLDPKMYSHIKDKEQRSPRPGDEITMTSLGGGTVGGHGDAKVDSWDKDEKPGKLKEFDTVTDRPELGQAIQQLATMLQKAPVGDKNVRELEKMVNQLVAKYKELTTSKSARQGPGGKVAPRPPRPWELNK